MQGHTSGASAVPASLRLDHAYDNASRKPLRPGPPVSVRLEDVFAARLADGVLGGADAGFVVAEWSDPGGPADQPPRLIAPLHVHLEDDEAWYVLEGALRFRVGDRELEAPAGAAVLGPTASRTRSGTQAQDPPVTCS